MSYKKVLIVISIAIVAAIFVVFIKNNNLSKTQKGGEIKLAPIQREDTSFDSVLKGMTSMSTTTPTVYED